MTQSSSSSNSSNFLLHRLLLLSVWADFICIYGSGFNFDTEEGDNVLPGFRDSIIGIKRGETKSFPLVFPDSWKQEDLRGVHAQFTVSSYATW